MLVSRIDIIAGPHRGGRTYAEVELDSNGVPERYLPIGDPFDPGGTAPIALASPVPADHAALLAPCIPRAVLGMAHNTGRADRLLPPQAFHKSPHSVVGPGHPIELWPGHVSVDAEAEIAVVIGTPARRLNSDNALDAVFGYTIGNDVTDRDAQASDSRWTEAKSRDTYTPLGPWIRTDLDPSDLRILLGDDDGLGREASTSGLARGIVEVLVYLTSVMTLYPGDIVLAGAAGPSHRLRPGAVSRILVPSIGELSNPVVEILDQAGMTGNARATA
jgi:2-keto-4-pentenoate hydratase/2-oxohepta-3-ene-1,7-dioic acid hydratase in catechol pathway